MADFAQEVVPVHVEDELKQSYLDYAMSVIVGRALPDVRDGLKPVHRRVLYAMHELNNDWNKPYKKSARVVGDVIGKYHPHGDSAVYDTMVRMAQPFSMRYMLIDGQGNFGSVDGDSPAAMRYTEVRMSRFAHSLLSDLEKETVDFSPNYDESEEAPTVLPTRIPNLLVNGTSGIAVGMATNIPPHNLNEVVNGCLALIDDPMLGVDELMQFIPGPDFPTQGLINGRAGIVQAYRTGRGRIYVRARTEIEVDGRSNREKIIVTELPYLVNKARLIEKIAELVRDKKIEGISGLRDESDKDGMRIVIELRRNEVPDVVLNNLYSQTQMQSVFGINMVALHDGQPKTMGLKQILEAFLRHRQEVVTRRTVYDLSKARERAHLLEGLGVALANIERVIALVRNAADPATARRALLEEQWGMGEVGALLEAASSGGIARPEGLDMQYGRIDGSYRLSPQQAQAILDLRLHKLTGLEQDKLLDEYEKLIEQINEFMAILSDRGRLMSVIREELNDVKAQFGDARRTEILSSQQDLSVEDLIADEAMVVTLSEEGYVKTQTLDTYQAQRRGGRGKSATALKDEDVIDQLVIASSHETLLCFSNHGKLYWLKVYSLPQAGRSSKGRPIVNYLPLQAEERIQAMLAVREFVAEQYVFLATAKGVVKKTALSEFSRPRASGIIALDLLEDDRLIGAEVTDGAREVMLFSDQGKVIRFPESEVRPMGRAARGVKGIQLPKDARVISLVVVPESGGDILTATENGFGKRTSLSEYRLQGRSGQGIISIQVNERNGLVVAAAIVSEDDEVMLLTDGGTLVRTRVAEVSQVGRNTQGVKLIHLTKGEKLTSVQPVDELEDAVVEGAIDSQGNE